MTVILPFGRAVTRQLSSRSNQLLTRLSSSNPLIRASWTSDDGTKTLDARAIYPGGKSRLSLIRGYADDAAPKTRGRQKGTSERTPADKTSSKPKSSAGTKKKTTAKGTTKRAVKQKPKKKPAPKPRVKKALTQKEIRLARRTTLTDLRTKALLTEPKQLPATTWLVYSTENKKDLKSFAEAGTRTKELAESYKHLSPEEHERLNHEANQNRVKNRSEYTKWVESHTPSEIRAANIARRSLSKEKKVKEGKKKAPVRLIRDDRIAKRPVTGYSLFVKDRFASGDFRNMTVPECSKLISREWKALSASEKKPYEDQSAADLARYQEEFRTVFGIDSQAKKPRRSRASSST